MNILQVVQGYPPEGIGGVAVYTHSLANELAKSHRVSVLFPVPRPPGSQIEVTETGEGPVRLIRVGVPLASATRAEHLIGVNTQVEQCFEGILKDNRFDVIGLQHPIGLSIGIIELARAHGIATVLTFHDPWFVCPRHTLLTSSMKPCSGNKGIRCLFCLAGGASGYEPRPVVQAARKLALGIALPFYPALVRASRDRPERFRLAANGCDRLLCLSRYHHELFRQHGFDTARMQIVPRGTEPFQREVREVRQTGKIRFAYLGSVFPHKGLHILVEAYRRLKDPAAVLSLHGFLPRQSPYASRLLKQCASLDIACTGTYQPEDVASLLSQSDVMIMPSVCFENRPLVITEALLAGVPIIASRIGGIPEIVQHGVNGLLFEPGDVEGLAAHMRSLIENPGLRDRLSAHRSEVVTMEQHARAIERVYLEVCGS